MRVFVKSFGCSTSLADGEVLAGCLTNAGYDQADSMASADIVIYNTCAVKGPTENRMIEALKQIPTDKKLIVAGCLPLINLERLIREVRFDGVVGPAAGERIAEVARHVSKGERIVALEGAAKAMPSLCLRRVRLNEVTSIIPVSYGCLGSCAYCCVRFARGQLRSYDVEEIVERARQDLASGARELWITSQDTACYGRDKGSDLAQLLEALCSIKEIFKIRVGMMTPNMLDDILEDLIDAFRDKHVFKFVHLPVQSGDDRILKGMSRFYSVDDFERIVREFRNTFPEITVSTDVICGFPGETDEAFRETLRLIEGVHPDVVNISKFFARPRTAAAEMKENFVSTSKIRHRSNAMAMLAKEVSFKRNQRWINWIGEVIVDEIGKTKGSWIGRNFAYKPIALNSQNKLLGKTLRVEVLKAHPTHLEAKVIE